MDEVYLEEIQTNIINKERYFRVGILSMFLLAMIIYAIYLFGIGIVSYYWPLTIALPYAIVNILAARKLPNQNNNLFKNIAFYIGIIAFLVLLFASIMMLLFSRFEKHDFKFIERIEEVIEFDFPNQGRIITKDFRESKATHARYQTLSRVSFSTDISDLENRIKASDKWTDELTKDMLLAIPNYLANNASYYLLYNIDNKTYNLKPLPGTYDYLLIYYYQDGEAAIIEYQVEIIEVENHD